MGIVSLLLGSVSTLWSIIGSTWVSGAIGFVGVVLGMIGARRNVKGAAAGLFLSVNGVAWFVIRTVFVASMDPIGKLLGLI